MEVIKILHCGLHSAIVEAPEVPRLLLRVCGPHGVAVPTPGLRVSGFAIPETPFLSAALWPLSRAGGILEIAGLSELMFKGWSCEGSRLLKFRSPAGSL